MDEIYIVTRYLIPVEGNDSRSQERYDSQVQAEKRFHTLIASDIDKATVLYELIQFIRGNDGICLGSYIIDNRVVE